VVDGARSRHRKEGHRVIVGRRHHHEGGAVQMQNYHDRLDIGQKRIVRFTGVLRRHRRRQTGKVQLRGEGNSGQPV